MDKTKEEPLQDGLEVQLNLHHLVGAVLLLPQVEVMLLEELLASSTPRKIPEELLVFSRSESVVHLQRPRFHHQDSLWTPPAGS